MAVSVIVSMVSTRALWLVPGLAKVRAEQAVGTLLGEGSNGSTAAERFSSLVPTHFLGFRGSGSCLLPELQSKPPMSCEHWSPLQLLYLSNPAVAVAVAVGWNSTENAMRILYLLLLKCVLFSNNLIYIMSFGGFSNMSVSTSLFTKWDSIFFHGEQKIESKFILIHAH